MNLVIDIGNTLVKLGLFDGDTLVFHDRCIPSLTTQKIHELHTNYPLKFNVIYSSSGAIDEGLEHYLSSTFNSFQLTHHTPVNFLNTYETPETLGLDRIALVSAAQYLYPQKNVLIIDAGTCITIDFKTSLGEYLGGNISPGLEMRLKALHHFTAKLPLVEFKTPKCSPLGKNTTDAILNGVINSVTFEIEEYISRYKSVYMDLTIILTGGNQQYLSTTLKSSIFADSTFQLYGLHAILEKILNA